MSEGGRERRESGRAVLELPVEYERLNALLSDYTHNLSRGGTFIRTDRPLAVGTALSFTIRAPELGEPIVLRGVVRWVVGAGEARADRPSGMGIGFIYDSPAHREALKARLDRLMVRIARAARLRKTHGEAGPQQSHPARPPMKPGPCPQGRPRQGLGRRHRERRQSEDARRRWRGRRHPSRCGPRSAEACRGIPEAPARRPLSHRRGANHSRI